MFKKGLLDEEREPTERIRKRVREVLASIRDAGAALDINTGGVRELGEPYPARWVIEEARALDVPITLGDDSHGPDDVGGGFRQVIEMLRSIGYATMQLVRGHRQFEPIAIG